MARKKRQLSREHQTAGAGQQLASADGVGDEEFDGDDLFEDGEPEPAAADTPERRTYVPTKGPSRSTGARETRRRRSQARTSRRRLFYGLGGGVIAAALITGLVLPSIGTFGSPGGTNAADGDINDSNPQDSSADVGTQVEIQTGGIVELGADHAAYTSIPPTSGPRYAESADWGVYQETVADEAAVGNLEEGGIVVNYNLSDQDQVADVQAFIEGQPDFPGCFVMHPYDAVPAGSITLTSWGWFETYTGVDRPGMQAFIEDHRNNAKLFLGNTCGADAEPEAQAADAG